LIKQQLKVVALACVVVLSLTGFSHGHGHSSHGGGGGGGCSGPSHSSASGSGSGSGIDSDDDSGMDDGSSMDDGASGSSGYTSSGSPDSYDGTVSAGDTATPGTTTGGRTPVTPGSRGRTTDSDDSSSGSSAKYATAKVKVVSCARPAKAGKAAVTSSKVKLTSSKGFAGTAQFEIDVTFVDDTGGRVDNASDFVHLKAGQTRTFTVPMSRPDKVSGVAKCKASAFAY
jgi:hypothetical protein